MAISPERICRFGKLFPTKNPLKFLNLQFLISKRKLKIEESLGKGEISVLKLHSSIRKSIIISDDSAFIKHLENNNIIFFVPSDLIILLKRLNKISLKEALYFLDKMRVFIKEDAYNETKRELKEV